MRTSELLMKNAIEFKFILHGCTGGEILKLLRAREPKKKNSVIEIL
jgi:hypothetical protein